VKIDPGTTGWDVSGAQLVDDLAGRIYVTGINQAKANELDLVWDNVDGSWSTATNWDNNVAPTVLSTALQDKPGRTAVVNTPGQVAHRLSITDGTVQVAAGSLTVTTNVDITGGELRLTGGTFSAPVVNLSGTGSMSLGQTVSLPLVNVSGSTAVINTGANQLQITDTYSADGLRVSASGAPVGLQGANLVSKVDRLTLLGGEVNVFTGGIPTEGLQLFYKFDEPAGPTAVDSSGAGRDGTYLGDAQPVDDPSRPGGGGRVVEFDGADDSVEVNPTISSKDMSIATWFYADNLSGWRVILNHDGWSGGNVHYQFNGHPLRWCVNGNSPGDVLFDGFTFEAGEWYHVVTTYDGDSATDNVKLYVNGQLVDVRSQSPNQIPTPTPGDIGAWNGNSREWDGKMDDFMIYSKTLTDEEVTALYQGTRFGMYSSGGFDMSTTELLVTSSTNLSLGGPVDFGNLSIVSGQTLGLSGAAASFASTTLDTSAVIDNAADVHLTRTSGLNSGGADVALTKRGAGELVLNQVANIGAGSTTVVEGGTLTLGGGGAGGVAPVTLQGGELRLASIGSPASLDFANPVTVAADAAVRAAKSAAVASDDGPLTMTLTQGLSVPPGVTASRWILTPPGRRGG